MAKDLIKFKGSKHKKPFIKQFGSYLAIALATAKMN